MGKPGKEVKSEKKGSGFDLRIRMRVRVLERGQVVTVPWGRGQRSSLKTVHRKKDYQREEKSILLP